ncbi:MAG TPA: MMPL family transporter, partial [Pirellulales bacterium]
MTFPIRGLLAVVLATPLLAFIGYGAVQALKPHANAPQEWAPPDHPARLTYDRFTRQFGSGDVLIVGWEGCTLSDPRLAKFAQAVREDAVLHQPNAELVTNVLTGGEAVDQLNESLDLSRAEAAARLRGVLVGPDGAATFAVVGFSPRGLVERDAVVAEIRRLLTDQADVPLADVKLAGPMANGQAIDQAGADSLKTFAPLAAAMLVLLCWMCLRSFPATLCVFGLALLGVAITLATMHYVGDKLDAPLIVLPPLLLILGTSSGIHLANYYFDAVRLGGPQGAAQRATRTAFLPCFLSALTTVAGFGSLVVSTLPPIRSFGTYSALGVGLTFFLFLGALPRLLAWLRVPAPPEETAAAFWSPIAAGIRWARLPIVVIGVTLLVVGSYGAQFLKTSVHITSFFRNDGKLLQDDAWLERRVAPLATIECLATFAPDCPLRPSERAAVVRKIVATLQSVPQVGGVVATTTFLPELSETTDVRSLVARKAFDRALPQRLAAIESTDYFRQTPEGEVWRATARVSETGVGDHGALLADVQTRLREATADVLDRGVSLASTGSTPLIHAVQHELFNALWSSFLSAFGVIAVVLMVLQRGVMRGLVAMIPNLFPIAVVFGVLGFSGAPIDIGSVMTASVALGVAVDDTLHFLSFFRRELDNGVDTPEAVGAAYRLCGSAMVQTTLVCTLGL